MRNDRLLRGFVADALKALVRSSVEKSLRVSWEPDVGIGMVSVIVECGCLGALLLLMRMLKDGDAWYGQRSLLREC